MGGGGTFSQSCKARPLKHSPPPRWGLAAKDGERRAELWGVWGSVPPLTWAAWLPHSACPR